MSSMVVSNIMRRKGRTAITIVAVAVSCALLVSMLSVSEGILQNATDAITVSKVDVGISGSMIDVHDIVENLEKDDRIRVASPSFYSSLTLSVPPNGEIVPVLAQGLIPEKSEAISTAEEKDRIKGWFDEPGDPFFQDGQYLDGVDSPHFTSELAISRHLSLDFDLEIGDTVEVFYNTTTIEFTIKAVFEMMMSDDAPFRLYFAALHLSELQYLSAVPGTPLSEYDRADGVDIYLINDVRTDLEKVESFAKELEDEYQLYRISTKKDQIEAIEKSVTISKAYYGALGSVTVSIGMLFVICIVIMNISERTKEIGILRAIGIRRRTIFTMFFLESLAMVFLGSVLGVILGITGSHYLGEYIASSFGFERDITVVTPMLIFLSMGATNLLGSLASVYPGYRASRMKIVEAMKND